MGHVAYKILVEKHEGKRLLGRPGRKWESNIKMYLMEMGFEVVHRIFGPKRDEVTGEWRKLHSEELHILYLSPNIIRQIKSRRMRWAGHVARMGEERKVYRVLVESRKERDLLEDRGADGRMGSEWILGRLAGWVWSGSSWLRIGTSGGLL
jgi:hypothetical protein